MMDNLHDAAVKPEFGFKRLTDCTAAFIADSYIFRRCARCKFWRSQDKWFDYSEGTRRWSSYCRPCRAVYDYEKNRDRDYKSERVRLKEEAFIMVGQSCAVCGETREQVLDFHHRDTEEAKAQRKMGWNRRQRYRHVIQNPDRYEVLCKNCHYLKHHPNSIPLD